ncbi:unnamed protein product [Vitrella brassicaformis CCMP3155]|uniref:Uncharacterized protein n=1 Tax=Vitrella brassicaformis (strain CCMP3155) TaxID=1169540 RepID=A0A0G4FIC8_VITBC|nr:unnamed protein product [Vitrella brassicaformis CCMP3155]|eukprot:CEM13240.1 unnamed protein product [Vitrella brassicaformis CCMP3155]
MKVAPAPKMPAGDRDESFVTSSLGGLSPESDEPMVECTGVQSRHRPAIEVSPVPSHKPQQSDKGRGTKTHSLRPSSQHASKAAPSVASRGPVREFPKMREQRDVAVQSPSQARDVGEVLCQRCMALERTSLYTKGMFGSIEEKPTEAAYCSPVQSKIEPGRSHHQHTTGDIQYREEEDRHMAFRYSNGFPVGHHVQADEHHSKPMSALEAAFVPLDGSESFRRHKQDPHYAERPHMKSLKPRVYPEASRLRLVERQSRRSQDRQMQQGLGEACERAKDPPRGISSPKQPHKRLAAQESGYCPSAQRREHQHEESLGDFPRPQMPYERSLPGERQEGRDSRVVELDNRRGGPGRDNDSAAPYRCDSSMDGAGWPRRPYSRVPIARAPFMPQREVSHCRSAYDRPCPPRYGLSREAQLDQWRRQGPTRPQRAVQEHNNQPTVIQQRDQWRVPPQRHKDDRADGSTRTHVTMSSHGADELRRQRLQGFTSIQYAEMKREEETRPSRTEERLRSDIGVLDEAFTSWIKRPALTMSEGDRRSTRSTTADTAAQTDESSIAYQEQPSRPSPLPHYAFVKLDPYVSPQPAARLAYKPPKKEGFESPPRSPCFGIRKSGCSEESRKGRPLPSAHKDATLAGRIVRINRKAPVSNGGRNDTSVCGYEERETVWTFRGRKMDVNERTVPPCGEKGDGWVT